MNRLIYALAAALLLAMPASAQPLPPSAATPPALPPACVAGALATLADGRVALCEPQLDGTRKCSELPLPAAAPAAPPSMQMDRASNCSIYERMVVDGKYICLPRR